MKKIVSSFLIVCLMLLVQVPAQAQFTQHNESDLDFLTRINNQASEMYTGANERDVRIKSVDPKSDGKMKRNKLRSKIKEFKKGKRKKNQEKRMRKFEERLRQLEAEFAAI